MSTSEAEPSRFRLLRAPATMYDEGLADAAPLTPFALPRLHPGIGATRAYTPSGAAR